MPRVKPVAWKADVAPEHQAVVDDVLGVFGAIRGPFSMMLHSREMTKRLLPMVPFFRDESVVDGKLRSLGVLAAVREREAAYAWAAQVAAARRNGLREEAIDQIGRAHVCHPVLSFIHSGAPKSAGAEAARRYAGRLSPSGGAATSNAFTTPHSMA